MNAESAGRSGVRRLYIAEPAAAYRVLPPLIVDCSVLVAALFLEPALGEQARATLERCELHAPELLEYEFANAAVKKLATAGEAIADAALVAFGAVDVTRHRVDAKDSFALARRYSLSGYDAAYLWLAGELNAPLATFDRRLAEAAGQYLGGSRN